MRRPHRVEGLQLGLAAGEGPTERPAHHLPRRADEPTPDPTPFTLGADNDEVQP